MLNPSDVFEDVSFNAIKNPEVEKRMEVETQRLLANIETDLDAIMTRMNIKTEAEVYDNLGAYIIAESTKCIHKICNDLVSEDPKPYSLKMSFSGSDYLRMTYERAGFDESMSKHQDVFLKGLMGIKTFPKKVDVKLNVSIQNPTLACGKVEVSSGDVVRRTIYDAYGPVLDRIVGDLRTLFKDAPDEARESMVESMMNNLRKVLLDNPQMVFDTPARLYQSYMKYATSIEIQNEEGKYESISKEALATKILEKLDTKISINDALSGIQFN